MTSFTDIYTLSNGVQIPCMGFGTYNAKGGDNLAINRTAIEAGYRYFDTASFGFVCAGEMSGPETGHAGLCGGVVAAEVTVNHAGEADVEREQHRYQSKHHKEGDEGYIDKSDDVAENKECHQPAYGH